MTTYLSAVVPVLDEHESLPAFHAEMVTALEAIEEAEPGRTWEIIYVDDGSSDGSTELMEKLALDDPEHVRLVVLRRNFGKSGALAAGFAEAGGERLVTLDADGQDVPAELPRLLAAMDADGLDLVGGWRRTREDRLAKRLTSVWYNAVTRAFSGLRVNDFNTGYKLMRAEVAEELPLYGEFHRFVPVLAHDLGFRVGEVAVTHRPRVAGRSKFLSPLRFPKTLLDLLTVLFLTRFADRPLYLFGGLGAGLVAIGTVVLGYLSVLKLAFGVGIGPRPLFFFGILALLAGLQLIGIGFIGDVLRHSLARERVPYRVRRIVGPLER